MEKKKNHLLKSRLFKLIGTATIFMSISLGVIVYEIMIDWENFATDYKDFFIVEEGSMRLNSFIAFPLLIGFLVFLFIARKRNNEFFREHTSIGILIAIMIFYLIYSVIVLTMAALIGAFFGSVVDETIFTPKAKREKRIHTEEHENDLEYEKEKRRILARKQAREDFGGNV
jgi:magnesium-transporting ATPase (P-type)